MRLRTVIVVAFSAAAVLFALRIAANAVANAERDQIDQLDTKASAIARDATRLLAQLQMAQLQRSAQGDDRSEQSQRRLAESVHTLDELPRGAWPQAESIRELAAPLPELVAAVRRARSSDAADSAQQALAQAVSTRTLQIAEEALGLAGAVEVERRRLRAERGDGSFAFWTTVFLLLGLAAWGVQRRILAPVETLKTIARQLAQGHLNARSGHRANDELGELSTAIDSMAQALQERDRRLAEVHRENDALLETLHAHAIVSVADRMGNIIDANENFVRISGYSREELIGRNHRMLRSGVQSAGFWHDMWSTISAGRPWRGEVCNRAKNGSLYWVDSLIAPFRDADGQIERYVSIRVDVSEAKRIEQRLEASERFLRQVSDALPMRLYYVDAGGIFRFANRSMWQTYGDRSDSVIGRPCEEVLGSKDHPLRLRMLDALTGAEQRFEFIRSVGDEERHVEVRLIPDVADDGTVRGAIGAGFDITDRKRAAIELSQTTELLRAVLDSASEVAIVVTDADGTIRLFNRGAERLLGRTSDDVIGTQRLQDFVDAGELAQAAVEASAASGRSITEDEVLFDEQMLAHPYTWTCTPGGERAQRLSVAVTRMGSGEDGRASHLAVAYDVTQRERSEASLREAVDRARLADLAKSRFLANMSHEIRTPMNGVLGLSYLLEQTQLDAQQASYLQRMQQSGRLLLRLLDDVLDLSKIEAGELALERVPFKLRHLVRDIVEFGRNQAESRSLAFNLLLDDNVPEVLEGDPLRVAQVLGNLLANAVKFTEHGSVSLQIGPIARRASDDQFKLRFTVTDTGIGIDPEAQRRIFEPFMQADDTVTRRFGGTGLGLSIVRHLLERMDGSLQLASTPGEGTRFIVDIPFGVSSPAMLTWHQLAAAPAVSQPLRGARVMVVDDSDVNRDVAEQILKLHGAAVITARDGAEAVELLRADHGLCDLILMDVQMPNMDGCEATRLVRRELGLHELPIVALTAAVMSSELAKTRSAGMTGYISKPFEPASLVRTVRSLLPKADGHEDALVSGTGTWNDQVGASAQPATSLVHDPDPAHENWPSIDGIDTAEARRRLGGDERLFKRLLGNLLNEYDELKPGCGAHLDPSPTLARRMHRLYGASSTLGALTVAALARDAELACASPDREGLADLLDALGEELALVRRHTASLPIGDATDPGAGEANQGEREVSEGTEEALLALLRQRDMAALTLFDASKTQLLQAYGSSALAELQCLVEELRFAEATTWLQARTGRQLAPTPPAARLHAERDTHEVTS